MAQKLNDLLRTELARLPTHAAPARASTAQVLLEHGLPEMREEHWTHANLRALEQVRTLLSATAPAPDARPALPPPLPGFRQVAFINGHPLHAAPANDRSFRPGAPASGDGDERFALLASLFGPAPMFIDAADGEAIEVLALGTGAPGSAYPRLRLRVAAGRTLRLVERHIGATAADALTCPHIDIQLERDAVLDHYRLQQCDAAALWFDTVTVRLAANAHYRVRHVMTGAAAARSTYTVALAERGARIDWHGLAAVRQRQSADCLVRIHHAARDTATSQLFRGVAGEQARIGFDADVRVAAEATGARVRQSLRGLIDAQGGAVSLRPRLTIRTDDIQASHGATTGQIDEQVLFYLLSRGLDPEQARALLKWAFLGDALSAIDVPAVRRVAERAAAGLVSDTLAAELLA